jgi:zinc protease
MKSLRLGAIFALVLAAFALRAGPIAAQVTSSQHRTPAGIAFHHLSSPGDTHHALAFAWVDGYALTLPGKEGLAVLAPRLLMEGGSRTMSESERIERLRDLQASIGFVGGPYHARGQLAAPKATFADTVGLLAELLADPALPADRLARAKRAAAAASRQSLENAEVLANRLYMRVTLGAGPLLNLSTAEASSYETVEVADVQAWRRAVLGRNGLTIVSAGPVPPEDVAKEIDRAFARLPAVGGGIGPRPELRAGGKVIVLERQVVQTAILAGGATGWTAAPDTLPGSAGVRVLGGGGFAGRLTKAVREGLGATYGIRAGFQQVHPRVFSVVINTLVDNTKVAPVLAAIRTEYARLRDGGVTAAELEPLKTRFIADAREQMRRSPAAAQRLRDLLLADYPADYLASYEAQIGALDVEAVNAGIRTRFPREPLTVVIVTPSAEGLGADCVIKAPAEIAKCE